MTQLLRTPSRSSLSRALWILALTGITACSDLFGPKERVVVMDIAPQQVLCVGVGPMQCLSVRQHPDTVWTLFYDGIEGFSFEPGYQYTIRVAVRTTARAWPIACWRSSRKCRPNGPSELAPQLNSGR